ncbi:hypothetical protein CTI12_AA477970 [Artemisia annua]|uniref:Uncharacterized protein n=1 Tax=Artemisia annua TaxID=35608 RepID=A0A2U1LLE1_ARTAN|nr:hypothetical protein CTI12_AA477970 [Artemisia annua]
MTGKTPPPNLPKQPIDKAYSITSIKAYIPTPLDLEKLNYNSLSNLLKRFCKTYYVHHHLEAPSSTSTGTAPIDPYHDTNDSLVVMWMSSTISPKLVDMVIDDSTTAHEVWKRLTDIFMIITNSKYLALYRLSGLTQHGVCILSVGFMSSSSICPIASNGPNTVIPYSHIATVNPVQSAQFSATQLSPV